MDDVRERLRRVSRIEEALVKAFEDADVPIDRSDDGDTMTCSLNEDMGVTWHLSLSSLARDIERLLS
ncbi:hypothetical protein [Martelella mediterranea]|uniref:Uncharacterized protein n=1 Tax=Martelella mediterranea TaxID=293089 RepID=A0A4R3NW67_9HYPH|nr:hypothetical protein [Martelella mediterranea]TCT41174.1 hypothetical protein EDC90_1007151 [Martelella mediterranea]